jgi:hypothetical protein
LISSPASPRTTDWTIKSIDTGAPFQVTNDTETK